MAAKKESVTFFSLTSEIKEGKFRPIYILDGEEAFYIDKLQEQIIDAALTPDERDFNLTIAYGVDTDIRELIAGCMRYPVMAQRQVVVLREAQNIGKATNKRVDTELDLLKNYAEKPLNSTILVICFKGGAFKSKATINAIKKNDTGVHFTSNKVRDYELPRLITTYVRQEGCIIDEKAVAMLANAVGTDLSRLFAEIGKLKILVGQDRRITPELIERNIGISKDYNNFELEDAFIYRNRAKVFSILNYYEKNPKNNPTVVVVAMLFGFFSNVLLVATAPDKSDAGLIAATGKSPFRIKKFKEAARNYSPMALVNIITYLRECDAKSKGINSRQDPYELLRELAFKILSA